MPTRNARNARNAPQNALAPPFWTLPAPPIRAYCANCGHSSHKRALHHHPRIGVCCQPCAFALQTALALVTNPQKPTPSGWFDNILITLHHSNHPYAISLLSDWLIRAHHWPK